MYGMGYKSLLAPIPCLQKDWNLPELAGRAPMEPRMLQTWWNGFPQERPVAFDLTPQSKSTGVWWSSRAVPRWSNAASLGKTLLEDQSHDSPLFGPANMALTLGGIVGCIL